MVKLKYLKIEKYRNVKPGTELHFRDSLNVVLGRNGTGKTTLLNLIVQILNWDFSKLQEEAASLEYGLHTPELDLSVRFHTEKTQASLEGLADTSNLPNELLASRDSHYTTAFEIRIAPQGEKPWTTHLDGSTLTLTTQDGIDHPINTVRPIIASNALAPLLLSINMTPQFRMSEDTYHNLWNMTRTSASPHQRFDESLSYFDQIIEEDSLSAVAQLNHKKGRGFLFRNGGPTSFASVLEEALQKNPEADELGIDSKEKGQDFLHRIVELLEFSSAKIRLQRTAKTNGPLPRIDFGKSQFSFTRRDGSVVNHSLLSYGQKRLLAFFYYLATYRASAVADELVNGMHHEWIKACLDELGERQAFLTSQNPLLLDYLPFESAEEVRSSFVLCRTEFHENREQLVWENMTAEDSEGFFKAYQVAIQHVSELLRTRGLW